MWYCKISEKTINKKSKTKHINSTSHKHKRNHSVVVKKYEIIRQEIDKRYSIINICARDC